MLPLGCCRLLCRHCTMPCLPQPFRQQASSLPNPSRCDTGRPEPHIAALLLPYWPVLLEQRSPGGHGLLPASDPAGLAGQSCPRCPAGHSLLSVQHDDTCRCKGATAKQPVGLLRT